LNWAWAKVAVRDLMLCWLLEMLGVRQQAILLCYNVGMFCRVPGSVELYKRMKKEYAASGDQLEAGLVVEHFLRSAING
jgi:hypothetical protein